MNDRMTSRALLGISALVLLSFASACGDSSPTSPIPVLAPGPTTASAQRPGSSLALGAASFGSDTEDFNCVDVPTVRVRFGPPGYVQGTKVGLYVYFGGVPLGPKRLRIWWDRDNDPIHYHDFVFPEDTTEIEDTYEHQYTEVTQRTEIMARVELIRDELTGNCARNRYVIVEPLQSSGAFGPTGPKTQTASVGLPLSSVNSFFNDDLEGVRFTAVVPLKIDSVWVQPNGPGNLVINLWDATGTTLFNSTSLPVAGGALQVPLGFSVAPGDYVLSLDTTVIPAGIGYTQGAATYPYQIPGVIQLTDTAFFLGFTGDYYYLYNWQVTW